MPHKIKVSIVGITGYTGLELLRILIAHPNVEIEYLTSRQHSGAPIGNVYPHLAHLDLRVSDTDHKTVAQDSDAVFLCLPHKTAQDAVAGMMGKTKIIDLSADYRLDNADTYKKHYGLDHKHAQLLGSVVYGLPELNRADIKGADVVANPGCFALLSQLMLLPFAGNISHADIMAITGSSGSGKSPVEGTHHPVRSHNMKSYNINAHRHIPEIIRTAKINEEQLSFVPTSGPFTRGIFASAFISLNKSVDLEQLIETQYSDEPFVRIMPEGQEVALANIVASNFCDLSFKQAPNGSIIVQGAIDNLVKGAAGCAVQNMNLMFNFDEKTGLDIFSPVYP